jgi:hypothetical protein
VRGPRERVHPTRPGRSSGKVPPGPRYHDTALVPGSGNRENDCSNPATDAPGVVLPEPLSNRMPIGGWASNAAGAEE